jgi:AcrR family transcriptional regulator
VKPRPDAIAEASAYPHGRVPRGVRERQIVAVAEELFAERGYEGASMDELARRAGVSKPVIYELVGNKEALFNRCFERAADELAASVAAAAAEHAGDLDGVIRATAVAFFEFIEAHRLAWAMLHSLDAGGRAAAHVSEIRSRQTAFAAAAIREQAARGGVDLAPARADAAAHALNGTFEAFADWWRDNPGVSVSELADWLADLILPGLRQLTGSPA